MIEDVSVKLAPPEYVLVKRLQFFQEGASQKHISDIRAMLRVSAAQIDLKEIARWVGLLNLQDQWKSVR